MEHKTPWEKGSIRKGRKTGKHFIHNSSKNPQIPRSQAEIRMCKSLWGENSVSILDKYPIVEREQEVLNVIMG